MSRRRTDTTEDTTLPPFRGIATLDILRYSDAPDAWLDRHREALEEVARESAVDVGLLDQWSGAVHRLDTGDGLIWIVVTSCLPSVVDPYFAALNRRLVEYDKRRPAASPRLAVRAAVHLGPVSRGHHGTSVNHACRLVDSDATRKALDVALQRGSFLAVALSDDAFKVTVGGFRTPTLTAESFQRVEAVVPGKQFRATAWVHVPGVGAPPVVGDSSTEPPADGRPDGATSPTPETAPGASVTASTRSGDATAIDRVTGNRSVNIGGRGNRIVESMPVKPADD